MVITSTEARNFCSTHKGMTVGEHILLIAVFITFVFGLFYLPEFVVVACLSLFLLMIWKAFLPLPFLRRESFSASNYIIVAIIIFIITGIIAFTAPAALDVITFITLFMMMFWSLTLPSVIREAHFHMLCHDSKESDVDVAIRNNRWDIVGKIAQYSEDANVVKYAITKAVESDKWDILVSFCNNRKDVATNSSAISLKDFAKLICDIALIKERWDVLAKIADLGRDNVSRIAREYLKGIGKRGVDLLFENKCIKALNYIGFYGKKEIRKYILDNAAKKGIWYIIETIGILGRPSDAKYARKLAERYNNRHVLGVIKSEELDFFPGDYEYGAIPSPQEFNDLIDFPFLLIIFLSITILSPVEITKKLALLGAVVAFMLTFVQGLGVFYAKRKVRSLKKAKTCK